MDEAISETKIRNLTIILLNSLANSVTIFGRNFTTLAKKSSSVYLIFG